MSTETAPKLTGVEAIDRVILENEEIRKALAAQEERIQAICKVLDEVHHPRPVS